jgi:methionine-rich copper-binding protein CopC
MNSFAFLRCGNMRVSLSILGLALLIAAPRALAHTHPEQMMPAPNAIVAAPPSVTIQFNGALEPKFSKITVTDAKGQLVSKDPSTVGTAARTITLPLPTLAPGVYTVTWVGVSVDSHRAQGSYKFTVKR